MSEKLWSPTHETVRNSLLSQFTNEVADQGAGSFDDYDALHQWSVENPADFWAAYWDFAELKASQKGDIAVKDLDRFPMNFNVFFHKMTISVDADRYSCSVLDKC